MASDSNRGGLWDIIFSFIGGAVGRVVVGVLTGLLAAFGIIQTQPQTVIPPEKIQQIARPDPFTGTQGRELEARIEALERAQQLDNQHRIDAATGYTRIRVLERRCQENNTRIQACERELERLEERFYQAFKK